ncbi:MAG: hypothetical protein ACYDHF_03995 [Candidatus Cryosericum sp.]
MKTTKPRSCSMTATFLSILLAMLLIAGCAPRVVGTVDVPVGDDMTTPIAEGETRSPYGGEVPVSIMKGTYVTDFSAVVKVMSVEDTRTLRGEITSPTSIVGQDPEHVVVILYLCKPLSNRADKLSDGTIVYKGDGYPQIILGNQYEVVGVLQPGWQDWPLVYIPTALQFKQASVTK